MVWKYECDPPTIFVVRFAECDALASLPYFAFGFAPLPCVTLDEQVVGSK